MYLEKVNMRTLCEIFQLGAYDDDIHRLSVQSETGWHLKSNDSPSQLIPIQKTKKYSEQIMKKIQQRV